MGGILGIVGVVEGVVEVRSGGELGEGGEDAFDGEVWLLLVLGGEMGVGVGKRSSVLGRARVGSGGEGGALVVTEVVEGMGGGDGGVGMEVNVVRGKGLEGVVERVVEEGRVGRVVEVVPVKVGGVVIAGQD